MRSKFLLLISIVLAPHVASSSTNQLSKVNDRTNELRQAIESENQPISFYGKVIDQDGQALSDVKIVMNVRHVEYGTLGVLSTFPKKDTMTDLDGHFEWKGETGDIVEIQNVTKAAYELEPNTRRDYAAATGSLQNPVIFKMWKTNIHEQLITGEQKFQIIPDGRPYFINLVKGTIAESGGGDLKVWVKRPEQIAYGSKYNWSCEMDAINGGILLEPDSYSSMFSSPSNGYKRSFEFDQKIGSGWGDSTGMKRFYVSLDNKRMYGRISVEIYAYFNKQIPALIRLSYVINPSGSRILR